MSTTGRSRTSALAILWLASVAGACTGASPGDASRADSLYIGVAAARAPRGEAYFNGSALAVAHLNARRPDGSPAFALRLPPDTTSQVAVAAAFRDDPTVIGVVGHTGSSQTLEAAPIYADVEHDGANAVVAVSPTATNPRVTQANDWIFRVCPTDDDVAKALARYVSDSLGIRRVAVIYRNDLFGRGFTRTFRGVFELEGGRLLERDPYLSGITEYQAYAGRIARGDAGALVIAGSAEDAAQIVRAMRAAGAPFPILGTDDLAALHVDPQAAQEFRGIRYSSFFVPERSASEAAIRFVNDFRTRFGREPDHRAALAYDAAMLIGVAALEAGTGRREIRDWIARVGRGGPAFTGATGSIRFDASRNPIDKSVWIVGIGR